MTIEIPKTGYLRVKVIPKSPKTELVEIMNDEEKTLKIRLKAIPEKGKANAELIKFLSQEMQVPKDSISIISGKTDHIKLLKIVL